MIRAKFTCNSVRKYKSTVWEGSKPVEGFNHEYEMSAVTGKGGGENESFFASTPTGSIKLSAVRNDLFEPGKTYYVDFTEATE